MTKKEKTDGQASSDRQAQDAASMASVGTKGEDNLRFAEKVEALEKALAEANSKAEENWDKALRTIAELENVKRRAEKDVSNAHKFALENFAKGLLPVVDSLEQALAQEVEVAEEQIQAMQSGIELTRKMFIDTLEKFGLEQINPQGEAFDPERHEAMSVVEVADAKPDTVVQVYRPGYLLHGRVVRPAMVVVAK